MGVHWGPQTVFGPPPMRAQTVYEARRLPMKPHRQSAAQVPRGGAARGRRDSNGRKEWTNWLGRAQKRNSVAKRAACFALVRANVLRPNKVAAPQTVCSAQRTVSRTRRRLCSICQCDTLAVSPLSSFRHLSATTLCGLLARQLEPTSAN